MPVTKMMAGIALAGLAGCTFAAELRDQFRPADCHLPFEQRLRIEIAAPIIVLGDVLQVSEIGEPQPSTGDRRVGTQLTRIKIHLDEVIKGAVSLNQIEFYYFAYSPAASEVDLGVPRYLPAVGQRRIYFLKRFEASYRSIGDVTDFTLRVSSGSHARGFCSGESPGCCIADLLLIPQPDVDVKWFIADLVQSEYAAEVLCSRPVARALMQKLVDYPEPGISERARETIGGTRFPR